MRFHFPRWSLVGGLIFGAVALAAEPAAAAGSWPRNEWGQIPLRNLAAREFVGNAQVWQIAEDDTGVLFFGNGPGLVTYDGATWRRVPIKSVADTVSAVVHAEGKTYAGGENFFGWLRPTGDGRHAFVSLIDDLPEKEKRFGRIENIAPHAGTLYLNATTDFLTWRDGRLALLPETMRGWTHILYGDRGPHYAYERGGAFRRVESDRGAVVSEDPRLSQSQVRFVGRAPDGALLVVQQSGDIWAVRDGGRVEAWPHEYADYLRARKLARGWQLADGTLVLAIMNGGLVFLDNDGRFLGRLDESNGLRNGLLLSMLATREGGLWFGLYNGAAYVDWALGATLFDRRNGLPSSNVRVVNRVHGTLYALTAEGVYGLAPASGPESPARFEQVFATDYYAIEATDTGCLVVDPEGLAIEKTAAGTQSFPAPSAKGGHTFALVRSRRDPSLVWVGHEHGVTLLRHSAEGWRDAGRVAGFAGDVRRLVEMPDGRLWGESRGLGVFRLTPGDAGDAAQTAGGATVEIFPVAAGRPAVAFVRGWDGGVIFSAAEGFGTVFRFDEKTRAFVLTTEVPALPDGLQIAGSVMGADAADHLWLRRTFARNEEKIIYRVGRDGSVAALPQRVHDAIDNVTVIYEETGPDGPVVWLAGTDGMLRVEWNRVRKNPPPLHTALWTTNGKVTAGARLPSEAGSLEFEFVAPRYSPVFPVTYQSRLVGGSEEWSEWSPARTRTFTHLAENNYRFEVRARDVDGHVSAPAVLAFTVLPPWWRTGWAYGGYATLFVGAMWGFARLRTRALRVKNDQLEKTVATRTQDLRRQNTELARLHKLELDEKISARLAAEKAQLDVLRYQLNPHFLFNSLSAIRGLIPPTQTVAQDTLDRLADFCRLTLDGRQPTEQTTVGEELAMLRTYLDIEQTRLAELLSVVIVADPAIEAKPLPRLLLLPLVENALKYGQATSAERVELVITASAGVEADSIVFEIANTGRWVEPGSLRGIPSTGIGHDNLRERLRRHYPEAHAFTHSAVDGWVRVRLSLGPTPRRL